MSDETIIPAAAGYKYLSISIGDRVLASFPIIAWAVRAAAAVVGGACAAILIDGSRRELNEQVGSVAHVVEAPDGSVWSRCYGNYVTLKEFLDAHPATTRLPELQQIRRLRDAPRLRAHAERGWLT
jgi:hypothetical protein